MSQKAPERQASRAQAEQTAKDEWTRTDESQERSSEGFAQAVAHPMPFLFRYRGYAHPVPLEVSRTDPTAGEWTSSWTSWDGKVEDDGTEDPDETDDGSNPQTGVIADSGTEDDEE
jgi:hypothetical protein